jgi:hypothetical protein
MEGRPVTVTVTGAAGQIANAPLFRIASANPGNHPARRWLLGFSITHETLICFRHPDCPDRHGLH